MHGLLVCSLQTALLTVSDTDDCAHTPRGWRGLSGGRVRTVSFLPPACQSRSVFSYDFVLQFIFWHLNTSPQAYISVTIWLVLTFQCALHTSSETPGNRFSTNTRIWTHRDMVHKQEQPQPASYEKAVVRLCDCYSQSEEQKEISWARDQICYMLQMYL